MGNQPLTMFCMSATIFNEDGSIDEAGQRAHLQRLVDARNGIYLGSGGAGEGHVLTPKELRQVYDIGVDVAKGKVPLYANPRESRTAAAMYEVAHEAVEAGVDVVQLYQLDGGHGMIPTQREQEAYWTELLDKISHPVAISIHGYAGYKATPAYLKDLCGRYEQICAINVMTQGNGYFMELRDELPERVKLYTGVAQLVEIATLGASGALLAENNIIPNICQQIADGFDHHLRSQWRTRGRFDLGQQAIPILHPTLRFFQEAAVGLAPKQRDQSRERRLGVPDEPDLDRIAQPNPVRLHIDLHTPRLAGLRVIFEPRHGRADDEHRVASFHCPR